MMPYELEDINKKALAVFLAIFVFRYTRFFIGIYTYLTNKPQPIREKPRYTSADVTVVVPTTFEEPEELVKTLQAIARCSPAAIFVVTSDANVDLVKAFVARRFIPNTICLGVAKLNKRVQMIAAMEKVTTAITVYADDDVIWPSAQYLDFLLAVFEDPQVGAGGTRQRVRRRFDNFWSFLGVAYLERRGHRDICTQAIDSSISTLSGCTAAYRTEIVQDPEFVYTFQNDHWRGRPLHSDDDKFLTRWVFSHGYRIAIQTDPRAVLQTTLEESPMFLSQALRWARAHWRGNFTVMEKETYWCSSKYLWGFYAIYIAQFQTPTLLVDGLHFLLLQLAFTSLPCVRDITFSAFGAFLFFSKIVKLIPHFCRHPEDLRYIPVSILFSYFHGILNVYAALTLTQTGWGSQNLHALEKARRDSATVPLLRNMGVGPNGRREPRTAISRGGGGQDHFSNMTVVETGALNCC